MVGLYEFQFVTPPDEYEQVVRPLENVEHPVKCAADAIDGIDTPIKMANALAIFFILAPCYIYSIPFLPIENPQRSHRPTTPSSVGRRCAEPLQTQPDGT